VRRGNPPTIRIEHTVLDLASDSQNVRDAVGWITRSYQRRLTTPDRVRRALDSRVRIKRRRLLLALTASVPADAESLLEHEYDRVTKAHGLPAPSAQVGETLSSLGGGTRSAHLRVRRDGAYREFNTVVELDGRLGHEDAWDTFRDMDRDNLTQEQGSATLRYGHADVFGRPCQLSRQVAVVLRQHGWTGDLRACGPNCTPLG
jgi:hypothetical protein